MDSKPPTCQRDAGSKDVPVLSVHVHVIHTPPPADLAAICSPDQCGPPATSSLRQHRGGFTSRARGDSSRVASSSPIGRRAASTLPTLSPNGLRDPTPRSIAHLYPVTPPGARWRETVLCWCYCVTTVSRRVHPQKSHSANECLGVQPS